MAASSHQGSFTAVQSTGDTFFFEDDESNLDKCLQDMPEDFQNMPDEVEEPLMRPEGSHSSSISMPETEYQWQTWDYSEHASRSGSSSPKAGSDQWLEEEETMASGASSPRTGTDQESTCEDSNTTCQEDSGNSFPVTPTFVEQAAQPCQLTPTPQLPQQSSPCPMFAPMQQMNVPSLQGCFVPMPMMMAPPMCCPPQTFVFQQSTNPFAQCATEMSRQVSSCSTSTTCEAMPRQETSSSTCSDLPQQQQQRPPLKLSLQEQLQEPQQESQEQETQKRKREKPKTTVMLRNLPNNYTREMLLEAIDAEGFRGQYDFFYMPMDFRSNANLGYAFLNFQRPEDVPAFWSAFDGFCKWKLPTCKAAYLSWSKTHGLRPHIERYRSSPVMHPDVPDHFRPLLFKKGERVAFPLPAHPIKAPAWRQ